jgi:hypothetical protein
MTPFKLILPAALAVALSCAAATPASAEVVAVTRHLGPLPTRAVRVVRVYRPAVVAVRPRPVIVAPAFYPVARPVVVQPVMRPVVVRRSVVVRPPVVVTRAVYVHR